MRFALVFSARALADYEALKANVSQAARLAAVRKTLGLLQSNLRHPSLRTHKFKMLSGPSGEPVFEAYAENRTPVAFRVFWHYGPGRGVITVVAIVAHP